MKQLSRLPLRRIAKVTLIFMFCYLCTVALLPISNQVMGQTQAIVSGLVTDSTGNGLSGVKVDFRNLSGALIATATTDFYGEFTVAPVAPGSYNLRLTKAGFTPITQPISVTTADQQEIEPITMTLALSLSASTLGYVINAGDRIQIPATVAYTGEGRETITFSVSAPQGWNTRILQGTYEVTQISLSTGQAAPLQLEVNAPATAIGGTNYNLTLTAIGTTQTNLNFTILLGTQTYGTVSGKVIDENGKSIGTVNIDVSTAAGATIKTDQSSTDGSFNLELQTGSYVLRFSKSGYVDVTKTITLSSSNPKASLGNVILTRTIRLTSSIVSISVRLGEIMVLPFTASNAGDESELVTFSVSAPQGWTTRILQGSYEITKIYLTSGQSLPLQFEVTAPTTVTGGIYNLTLTAIGITQANQSFTIVLLQGTQTNGTASGQVVDENGKSMSTVSIDVSTTTGTLIKTAQSSTDGSFSIDLSTGTYVLRFYKGGYVDATKPVTPTTSNPKVALGNVMLARTIWLTSSIVSMSVHPGDIVTLPVTVSNMGKELEPVTFSVSAPSGWSAKVLDPNFELGTLSLSPSGNTNVQLEVKVPFGADGTYSLSVSAVGDITTSLNFTAKVEPPSSSMLSCSYPGKSTSPGEIAKFQVKLTNPFGMDMRFKLSVESLPTNWTGLVKTADGDFMTEIFLGGHESADLVVEVKSSSSSATDMNYAFLVKAEAVGQSLTDSLSLTTSLTELAGAISLSARLPEVAIDAGNHVDYQVSVGNMGVEDRNLVLSANVPANWKVIFKLDNSEITRLLLYGGNKSDIIVQVIPPSAISLGTYTFPFQVLSEAGNVLAETNLTTTIRGSYSLNMGTSTLMASVNSGESTSFTVTLTNSGFTSINGVTLNVSLPDDSWSYTVNPVQVPRLGPREPATFTVTIKTGANTVSGDYYVTVKGSSEQTTTEGRDIRMSVSASTSWGFIGVGVAVAFIVILVLVFRKFRRR